MNNQKITSREIFWWLLNVVMVMVVITSFGVVKLLNAGIQSRPSSRTIVVGGEGRVVAIPDIARVSFSVVSEGLNAATLQEENIKKINKAIEFVKAQGIDEKDIKTEQYSLSPRYNYDKNTGQSYIYGYTITQTVSLKIRKFEKISAILAELPSQGINQISSLSFGIDESDEYLSEARKEAFEKARAKAEEMARQNGVKIGKIVTFTESTSGFPVPYYERYATGAANDGAKIAPQIEAGSEEVTVQVSVTFEIK